MRGYPEPECRVNAAPVSDQILLQFSGDDGVRTLFLTPPSARTHARLRRWAQAVLESPSDPFEAA